jgi:Competence protein J (ComJ)
MTSELASISLDVSFGQIAVFASTLESPFNDWTDKHVAQGFAWRPGSVSFRTLEQDGPHSVTVVVVEHVGPVSADAVRAIDVPFDVPAHEMLEIASISESAQVSIPAGRHLLRCEFLPVHGNTAPVRLTFGTKDDAHFRIALADAELSQDGELLTTAEPAQS